MSAKDILRREIKERLKNIPGHEFHFQGTTAALLLSSSPFWNDFKNIFIFVSTNSEIDTQPLLETAIKDGKKVFVPKVEADSLSKDNKTDDRLVFHQIRTIDGPWHQGPFGIREPLCGRTPLASDFPALILAPGLAFDRNGNRLGHGKGYYDRFLAELDSEGRRNTTLGFCMDFQIVSMVPTEDKDIKMNGILTGKEFIILN